MQAGAAARRMDRLPWCAMQSTQAAGRAVVPEPPATPVIGHVLQLRRDPLKFLLDAAEQHGDLVRLRLGRTPTYLITHPDDLRLVLKDQYKSFTKRTGLYSVLQVYLGDGLLTSEGEPWLAHRKLIVPVFRQKKLDRFAETITRATAEMLDRWELNAASGEPLNVAAEFGGLALRVIAETVLGAEALKDISVIEEAMSAVQQFCADRLYAIVPIPLFVPTPSNRRTRHAVRIFDEMAYRFIDQRKARGDFGDDILSHLLTPDATGKSLTRKEMRDEVVTLFNTGHDTTAHALTWTLWALAQHPEVAQKVDREVADTLGGRTPTASDVPALRYVDRVFHESLRLYPPAWIYARVALEQIQLQKATLPAGVQLLISPYVVHRLSRLWPRAGEFLPDRWEQEPAPFSFLAFGGGAHRCIGESFATMEATMVMAQMIQRFSFEEIPGHQVRPDPLITLFPKGGLMLRVKRRAV